MNRREFLGLVSLFGMHLPFQSLTAQEPSIPEVKTSPKVIVDLSRQILTLYIPNPTEYPCVVGRKNHSGNSVTPSGLYVVISKSHSDSLLQGRFGQVYGRRFIQMKNLRSGRLIGIHGTDDEDKLSEDVRYFSRGCVRIYNEHIENNVYPNINAGDYVHIVDSAGVLPSLISNPKSFKSAEGGH